MITSDPISASPVARCSSCGQPSPCAHVLAVVAEAEPTTPTPDPPPDPVLAAALMFAARYARGRDTGAPVAVLQALDRHRDVLDPHARAQIARETRDDIASGRAGAPDSVAVWRRVIDLMEKSDV